MSEKLTKLEWESIGYIVRVVEDRDDISLNQFELIFRALHESLTIQATIDTLHADVGRLNANLKERIAQNMDWETDQRTIVELRREVGDCAIRLAVGKSVTAGDAATIADLQATIDELTRMANEVPGCRCGCRSTGQTDQIAELYRQISTIEAELNERKGRAMVWESDQLIIAKLQEQIEALAAENLELNHMKGISEGNNYYMAQIGILERRAKQAEDNHEICAGALLAESQRIETMRIENLGAKRTLEYIAKGPWKTVDEYVLSVKDCLNIAIAEKEQLVKFTAALEEERDKALQMVRDWNHEHTKARSRISELEAAGSTGSCYHDWFEGNACAKCGALRKPVQANCGHVWRAHRYTTGWQECGECGHVRDAEPVSDQRAKGFECECPYHSCALATVFYGHCQICGGEWIPF